MSFLVHEEPKHSFKPCRLLLSALKDAFIQCHSFRRSLPAPNVDENEENAAASDIDEQEVVILTIRTRAMEAKLKRKGNLKFENFQWVLSPMKGELLGYPKGMQGLTENEDQDDDAETEAFFSVDSCFTRCSSTASREVFFSTRSGFSRCCSSAKGIEFGDVWRKHSIIRELRNCEGWPFGLCRKAMMLPPLPNSPSESWSWRKAPQMVKVRSF